MQTQRDGEMAEYGFYAEKQGKWNKWWRRRWFHVSEKTGVIMYWGTQEECRYSSRPGQDGCEVDPAAFLSTKGSIDVMYTINHVEEGELTIVARSGRKYRLKACSAKARILLSFPQQQSTATETARLPGKKLQRPNNAPVYHFYSDQLDINDWLSFSTYVSKYLPSPFLNARINWLVPYIPLAMSGIVLILSIYLYPLFISLYGVSISLACAFLSMPVYHFTALLLLGGTAAAITIAAVVVGVISACLALLWFPSLLGWLLTRVLASKVTLGRIPLDFGAVHISPWLRDRKLHLLVRVDGFGLGNPPARPGQKGYPHHYFLHVGHVSFGLALSFDTITSVVGHWRQLIQGELWSPFPTSTPKTTASPAVPPTEARGGSLPASPSPSPLPRAQAATADDTNAASGPTYIGLLQFSHIEFEDTYVNFEMANGEACANTAHAQ
jgi:hypothetical protein